MWQIISNNFIYGVSLFFGTLTLLYVIQINRNYSSSDFCIYQNNHDQSSLFFGRTIKRSSYHLFNNSYQILKSESLIQSLVFNYKFIFLLLIIFVLTLFLFWKRKLYFLANSCNSFEDDRKVLRFLDCIEDSLRKKYDLYQMKKEELNYKNQTFSTSNCDNYKILDSVSNNSIYNKENCSINNNSGQLCSNSSKKVCTEDIIFSAENLLFISTDIMPKNLLRFNNKHDFSNYDDFLTKHSILSNCQISSNVPNSNNNTNNNNNIESKTEQNFNSYAKMHINTIESNSNIDKSLNTNIQQDSKSSIHITNNNNVTFNENKPNVDISDEIKDILSCYLDEDTLIEDAGICLSSEVRKLWPKVVQIITERELGITKRIVDFNGVEKVMWAWAPFSLTNNKNKWQGPAVFPPIKINPPTPCLKIRNIIDRQFVEHNKEGWDKALMQLILEKSNLNRGIDDLIFSEKESTVCVKCVNEKSAGKIFEAINGWWFSGKLVSVKFLPLKRFIIKKKNQLGHGSFVENYKIVLNTNL